MPPMKNPARNAWYGWKRDLPDPFNRDIPFSLPVTAITFPPELTLGNLPKIFNQSSIGSCVGNAVSSAHFYQQLRQHADAKAFYPSRLFIYYNARALIGEVNQDSGCYIRDAFKTINKAGVCSETVWPYIIAKYRTKPTVATYKAALKHQVIQYKRVYQNTVDLKTCLALGKPFVFGFNVYDGFESDAVTRTGIVQLPKPGEEFLGGHAVFCYGWKDSTRRFLCQNSWGSNWGNGGRFTMPYDYILNPNLAADFWTMDLLEVP